MPPEPPLSPESLNQRSYFETFPISGLRNLSSWTGIAVLSTAVALAGYWKWELCNLLGTIAVLAICIAIVPITMKAIYSVLFSWAQAVPSFLRENETEQQWQEWFNGQIMGFNISWGPFCFALVYAVFALWLFNRGEAFAGLPAFMKMVCRVITFIASFVCGVGLAAMFGLARLIWRMGKRFSVRIAEHSYGVLSTGRMLVRSYALVAIVWCLYTASASFTLSGKLPPLLGLAIPAVIFFVGSFVICQLPLRKRMVEYKRAMLIRLENLFESLLPKQPDEMTEERQRQMAFYLSELKRVQNWPEWPFSVGNLSGVMGASLGAIAPQIIHLVLGSKFPSH